MISLLPIFRRQFELMEKFEEIEQQNQLLEIKGVVGKHLEVPEAQAKLRRLAWAITEEVTEALDLGFCGMQEPYREEVADAFHYLVEMMVIVEAAQPVQNLEDAFTGTNPRMSPAEHWMAFLIQLGRTMNLLKNRPHKQAKKFKPVNREQFIGRLQDTFFAFIMACEASGITANELNGSYMTKASENEKRATGSNP